MLWLVILAAIAGSCAGAATQQQAGIEQFWTDDYKVFDQVYGKTSDKALYGATLPASVSYNSDATKFNKQASEKKERYVDGNHNIDLVIDQTDPQTYGARYQTLLTNQALKKLVTKKPTKATKFIASDFKPLITKQSDPETYNYLKHLELMQIQKEQPSQININGFKPFLNHAPGKTDDADAYKSIQDILEAHEANRGKNKDIVEADDQVKYLSYGGGGGKGRGPVKKAKPRPPSAKGKPPCPGGRCRKRTTNSFRGRTYLTRPYVRKIKKIISY